MSRLLITGATGLVGRALTEALNAAGHTVRGVARTRPGWWMPEHPFLEMDLLRDDPVMLKPALAEADGVLHVCDLGKVDVARNKHVARACYTLCKGTPVRAFLYFSSIRVYADRIGDVDETSSPSPCPGDPYGICKAEIEVLLSELEDKNGVRLAILRLGNVFSKDTPHKFPEPRDALTRFRYRGMNPHLIGTRNAAYAVARLLSDHAERCHGVFNITQEWAGQNDYFYLCDRLNGGRGEPAALSAPGRRIRAWLSARRGEGPAGYFNTVLEARLRDLGIEYPETLLEQLTADRIDPDGGRTAAADRNSG
jgi:nucleoside-diphosphate-sugar epimerase